MKSIESMTPTKEAIKIKRKTKWNFKRNWPLHLLVMPAFILALIFNYGPLPGIVMAFQEFKPWLGFF